MGFVWASVSGKLYGRNVDADVAARPPGVPKKTPHTIALDAEMQQACGVAVGGKAASSADAAMHRFLLNLALCNTVVPTTGPDGQPVYQVCVLSVQPVAVLMQVAG
jgi:phospholipid-translocating ATPase/phospholipid-transporting ATPase